MDVSPEFRDAWRGIDDVRSHLERLAGFRFESSRHAVDSFRASVAERVHVQSLGGLVFGQKSSDGFGDVFASPDFGLEHELLGVYCHEDDSR